MNYIEAFINSGFFPMFLRILEFVFMTVLFVKGEINVSKYAQSFTNMERRFMFSDCKQQVIPELEDTDLQAELNSHKDECLSSFLDKYLDFSKDTLPFAVDELADGEYDMLNELVGSKADKVLKAYDSLMDIRERYNVPERFSNEELVSYLREASKNGEMVSGPTIEKLHDLEKGGKPNDKETKTEQSSE